MSKPFTLTPVTAPEFFDGSRGGRGQQAQRLLQNITRADPLPDSISIVGERGAGKTSLLGYLRQAAAGRPSLFVAGMSLSQLPQQSPSGFYTLLTQALTAAGALPAGHPSIDHPFVFRELLTDLEVSGQRLVLCIDDFDVVARNQQFDLSFFDSLRSAATLLPLALMVASVAPLSEVAHSDMHGSPFFNIFNPERLGLLSVAEAEALVARGNFGSAGPAIIALAGRHPYFLQMACGTAWDLRAARSTIDLGELRALFDQQKRSIV